MNLWWLVLLGYLLGTAVAFVIIFRMMAADDVIGVHTAKTPGEAVGLIAVGGVLSFLSALFWPLLAFVLVAYRLLVAPRKPRA